MKTYYIPSSYRGKKHRRALVGGCLRGYGVIENGKEITLVNPVEAIEKLHLKPIITITKAESINQPVEIKKTQLSLFSAITHDAKKGYNYLKKKWDNLNPTVKKVIKYGALGAMGAIIGTKFVIDPYIKKENKESTDKYNEIISNEQNINKENQITIRELENNIKKLHENQKEIVVVVQK